MILVRAPLRVSFVGGGTDLPEFYRQRPGRVISVTIDKFVYVLINPTPLVDKFTVKYQKTEAVDHPSQLEHTRLRAALMDLGIVHSGIEVGSFADLPAKTGLGSSSSFSVALVRGLYAYLHRPLGKAAAAEEASRLEIDLVGEPIGKQDQYAASFGGFNIFQFNPDDSVEVRPVLLDYRKRSLLEDHMLLFFTGVTRPASSVLTEQRSKVGEHFETYSAMADSVPDFARRVLEGDLEGMARMLHEGWLRKKSLASGVSSSVIDTLYETGLAAGAWGGKILGAGGGGCLLFLTPHPKRAAVLSAVTEAARRGGLKDFKEIGVRLVQSGTDIVYNNQMGHALPE
jgi:D-glycero-alpha-D-manno-heptose-7-phosphate kinase